MFHQNFFAKPKRTKTGVTSSAGSGYADELAGMYQDYIGQGPAVWTGGNPYETGINPMLDQWQAGISGMAGSYGAPGGYFDQATGAAQDMTQFTPDQMTAGSFLQGPGMNEYLNRMGYDPAKEEQLAMDRAGRAMRMAGINESTMAQQLNAGGPSATRSGVQRGAAQGQIASDVSQQLAQRDWQAKQAAARMMQRDIDRSTTADRFNIGNQFRTQGVRGTGINLMRDISPQLAMYGAMGDIGKYGDLRDINKGMFNYQDFLRGTQFMPSALGQYGQFVSSAPWQTTTRQTGQGKSTGEQLLGIGTTLGAAKLMGLCLPEGTKIDTPAGSIPIEDIKVGINVNGMYGGTSEVLQVHQYKEDPGAERFAAVVFDNGSRVDCCDMHRINGKRTKDYRIGDKIGSHKIVSISWYNGVKRSYDLLTDSGGYRIGNIPVDSMIEELAELTTMLKKAA